MHKYLAVFLIVLAAIAAEARATPIISVGNHTWHTPAADFVFDIVVSGGDHVTGVDLNLFIHGGADTPIITAIDLVGPGTIFAANNIGVVQDISPPGRELDAITATQSGFVIASGVLAHVHVSSTSVGSFILSLTASGSPSFFQSDSGNSGILVDGVLVPEPEPSTFVLAALGLIGVVAMRRRF